MRGEEAAAGRCRRRPRPRQHRTRIDGATAVPALLLGIVLAASKVIVQDGGFIPISFPAAEALPREETDRTRGGEIRRGGRDLLNIFERTSTGEVRAKATSSSLARNCNQKCRRCKRLARKGQKRRMRKCTRNRAKKCTSECDVVFWPNGRRPTGSPPGQRPTGRPPGNARRDRRHHRHRRLRSARACAQMPTWRATISSITTTILNRSTASSAGSIGTAATAPNSILPSATTSASLKILKRNACGSITGSRIGAVSSVRCVPTPATS